METILLAFAPLLVVGVTQAIKKLQTIQYSENRKSVIRAGALTLSFMAVVASSVANGQEISPLMIEEFVKTLLVFTSTQVPYMFGKTSGEK